MSCSILQLWRIIVYPSVKSVFLLPPSHTLPTNTHSWSKTHTLQNPHTPPPIHTVTHSNTHSCTYITTHIHTHTPKHTHQYKRMHTYTNMHIHLCTLTHTHTHQHAHTPMHTHTHTHTHQHTPEHTHTNTHRPIHPTLTHTDTPKHTHTNTNCQTTPRCQPLFKKVSCACLVRVLYVFWLCLVCCLVVLYVPCADRKSVV